MFSLERHAHGYELGLLFFGVNSLLVGYLVARSRFLPALLGYALVAAGVVYLSGSMLRILAPGWSEAFAPVYLAPLAAESAFALWLILHGVNRDAFAAATPSAPRDRTCCTCVAIVHVTLQPHRRLRAQTPRSATS